MEGRLLRKSFGRAIEIELTDVFGHEVSGFQFSIEKQQVWELFNTIDLQMILVADESKVSAKGHNEILDVLNDALFYNSFVYIYFFAFPNLFYIDKIEQIFILEHFYSTSSFFRIVDGSGKIVRHVPLTMVSILLYKLAELLYGKMFLYSAVNIIKACRSFFWSTNDGRVVCEWYFKEVLNRKIWNIRNR